MMKRMFHPILTAILVLILTTLACGAAQTSNATQAPTDTAEAPTATVMPTRTPAPTSTPDAAATQQYDEFYSTVKEYHDQGYISTLEGDYVVLDDFSESWPQIGWYQWWPQDRTITNFVFGAHFSWETASSTPDISGCGVIFGLQSNSSHYAVFLDKSRVLFLRADAASKGAREVGKTKGKGRVSFSNPAEADFSLAVSDKHAYVYVNKEFIGEYTLSADASTEGDFAFTLLSGTNKDFGTKCEMTNAKLWVLK